MKISTIYKKSIKPARADLLKKGSSNAKLGYVVTSKKWGGKRLYSLTLVERETCPTTCHHWNDCYGNNMPFAHRFDQENIESHLESDMEALLKKHKNGIVIRLHVLGDFFSTDYVEFWQDMLLKHPKLSLFGYTGRLKNQSIGKAIWFLNNRFADRCSIRYSQNASFDAADSTSIYAAEESFEGASFDCPEQKGKVKDCASCGLCWTTSKTVRFTTH
jgi:hypothetical protein